MFITVSKLSVFLIFIEIEGKKYMIMIGDFPLHADGREVSINRSRHAW